MLDSRPPRWLFDGDALGQVAGLVDVAAQLGRHMVGQQLQRDVQQQGVQLGFAAGDTDNRVGEARGQIGAGDRDDRAIRAAAAGENSSVTVLLFSGNLWPQIQAVFPEQTPIERSSMNSWDDKNFVAAIEKTGRKKIVLAGLWTETCVALPTVQAIHDNYEVYVVEDCCGDVSQLSHDNAMKRMIQAGAKPVTVLSVMLEWQRDWAERDTYDAVMDIVKSHFGAYGMGVEYAYTMVHGAPATKFPEYTVPAAPPAHK